MSDIAYIGVDDTDVIGSPGTGRVARELELHLENLGLGAPLGVTRHQLLVDSRIKYTSHNSSLCIGFRLARPVEALYSPAGAFLKEHFWDGADPGLCIALADRVAADVAAFGHRAQGQVLSKPEAYAIANAAGLFLKEFGGTGDGIIGALAGVGLRAEGNDGRFVDLRGIREVQGIVTVGELLRRTGIAAVMGPDGTSLGEDERIDTQSWARPSLVGGRPVLRVELAPSSNGKRVWLPVERKAGHDKKDKRGVR